MFYFEDDETRNKYAQFHQNCCVTLRVMSSTETIDVEAFETHNIETNLLALEIFPWMEWLDLYIIFERCLNLDSFLFAPWDLEVTINAETCFYVSLSQSCLQLWPLKMIEKKVFGNL